MTAGRYMINLPGTVAGVSKIWNGDPQPLATLDRMRDIVRAEYEEPSLVEIATDIAERVQEKNDAAIASGILSYLRTKTRFVADPVGEQNLKSPLYMLELIAKDDRAGGDCADIAMLAAALDLAVGLDAKFISEAYQSGPGPMSARLVHVYTIAQVQGDRWVNQDTQRTPAQADTHPVFRVEMLLP